MKGILGADRQRNSSELGKEGRLFVLFVAQIMGCYLANVRKEKLSDKYHSIQDILNEMRPRASRNQALHHSLHWKTN